MNASLRHMVCLACNAVNRVPSDRPAGRAICGHCHQPLFRGMPAPVDSATFERQLNHNDIPLLVDFWAPWCGPCRAMAPAFEGAAKELEPDYRLLKVNTEEAPELAARYRIRSIPTLMLFFGGKLVAQSSGARALDGILSWVRGQRAA